MIEIITIEGCVILTTETELKMNENELVFNLKNFNSGLYMLKITSSVTSETIYSKFVKTKILYLPSEAEKITLQKSITICRQCLKKRLLRLPTKTFRQFLCFGFLFYKQV